MDAHRRIKGEFMENAEKMTKTELVAKIYDLEIEKEKEIKSLIEVKDQAIRETFNLKTLLGVKEKEFISMQDDIISFKKEMIESFEKKDKEIKETKENAEKEIKSMIEVKDNAVKSEHSLRVEIEFLKEKNKQINDENQGLKNTLDKLAFLFDETFKSFQDQNLLLGAISRNANTTQQFLQGKVDLFNSPKKEGENQ